MSSFICEHCGTACHDTDHGYVTGCVHYPAETCDICGKSMHRHNPACPQHRMKFYERALRDIIKHQDLIGGTMAKMSATRMIAANALERVNKSS